MKIRVLILLFLCASGAVFSQVDLSVSVINFQKNEPIGRISVQLINQSIGFMDTKNTDKFGRVTFNGLSVAGSYAVEILATADFQSARKTDIFLQNQTNADVQISLIPREMKIGDLSEITVRGSTKINARNAEVSSVLSQKEIESLPLEGRDITRILFRMPNVVQATGFYPESPNVSINGSNSLFTNYLIDGMDNNEQFLGGQKFNIPVGFVKNINVLTNNFSTEYGLTSNGVVNITSKSGSNNYSGEVFVVSRPGPAMDAPSRFAQRDLSGNQVKDGFQRQQIGGGWGGAIRKDRTFFYVNAEYSRDLKDNLLTSPRLGVNETVRGENNFTYLSAKIDQKWSKRFHSALRANVGLVNIERQGGGLEGGVIFPSAANFQDRNSVLVASQNTFVGEHFKSETNLQYSRFRWNYGRPANENSPQVVVLGLLGLPFAVLGHPGYSFDETENTVQAQQKATFYSRRHAFKTGVELISADHKLIGGGNVNGNYTVQPDPIQLLILKNKNLGGNLNINDIPADVQVVNYNVELRPASFGGRQNIFSAYLEDAFEATNRLKLTLGVRYDVDNLSKGGTQKVDLNNVAPRFSFNYKLHSTRSLRGGYGIFYDKILYAIYSDALQQNTTDTDYKKQLAELVRLEKLPANTNIDAITFDGNVSATAPATYLNGPKYTELQGQRANVFSGERRILNPNGYQNPYSHQFSLGFQQQMSETQLFYVDLVFNESRNLLRLRDLNAPSAWAKDSVRSVADADASRPIPIKNGAATVGGEVLTGVARNVVMSETKGKSQYVGLSLNFQKEKGIENYAYRLIYTLSRLKNNTEDINFKAEDANNFDREYAVGLNDRTHVINGIFSYFPIKNWSISIASLLQSGQPINRIPDASEFGTTDLNGDGRSFGDAYVGNSDRQPGEARNSDRLPWSNTFDFNSEFSVKIKGASDLILRADVFNLFNAVNLSGYSNNATQSNQIQVGAAASGVLVRRNSAPPRQFQFSLRYAF